MVGWYYIFFGKLNSVLNKTITLFDDVINKPVSKNQFIEIISKYLKSEVTNKEINPKMEPVILLTQKQKNHIKTVFFAKWLSLKGLMIDSEIEEFATELKIYADKENQAFLKGYCEKLIIQSQNFDIEHLVKNFERFEDLIK